MPSTLLLVTLKLVDITANKGFHIVKNQIDGEDDADFSKEREEKSPVFPHEEAVYQSVPIIKKPARKIVEIKVFYDDGTYENFHCSPK